MTYADRWLLPDGVEEILPAEAKAIDSLRRRLLDLYSTWGYDMVIPPLLEYTDSLLIGLGRDVDLLTFKVTDQLSGRTLGIRADITPQTARMDAHSFNRTGANRLCYAGHVVHTRPKNPLATRTPIQAGLELYGEVGPAADIEVVSLLLESLQVAGLPRLHIDLGHVGIYRAIAADSGLTKAQEETFLNCCSAKLLLKFALGFPLILLIRTKPNCFWPCLSWRVIRRFCSAPVNCSVALWRRRPQLINWPKLPA